MNILPSSTFPRAFIARQTSSVVEYSFGQFESDVPLTSPPNLLPIPAYLLWGQSEEKALMLFNNSQNTGVLSVLF